MGGPNSWMFYEGKSQSNSWMMTRGSPMTQETSICILLYHLLSDFDVSGLPLSPPKNMDGAMTSMTDGIWRVNFKNEDRMMVPVFTL